MRLTLIYQAVSFFSQSFWSNDYHLFFVCLFGTNEGAKQYTSYKTGNSHGDQSHLFWIMEEDNVFLKNICLPSHHYFPNSQKWDPVVDYLLGSEHR